MSSHAMSRVALTVPLKAVPRAAIRVLMIYAHAAETDGDGRSHAALSRLWIAHVLTCAPATVDKAIRDLVAAGLLVEAAPAHHTDSGWAYTLYEVHPEEVHPRGAPGM
jgi:hypothetical protein